MWESLWRITCERCCVRSRGYKRHSGFQTRLLFTTVAENFTPNDSALTRAFLWRGRREREQVRGAVRQRHGAWNRRRWHWNRHRTRSMSLLEGRTPHWRWSCGGTPVRHQTRSWLALDPLDRRVEVRTTNLTGRNACRWQEHPATASLRPRLALRILKSCCTVCSHLAHWRAIASAARSVRPICCVSRTVEVVKENVDLVWWKKLVRLNQIHVVCCAVRGRWLHSLACMSAFVLLTNCRMNPSMFRSHSFHLQSANSRETFKRTEVLLKANRTQNWQWGVYFNGLISPVTITTGNNR